MDKTFQGILIAVIIFGSGYLTYSFVIPTPDVPEAAEFITSADDAEKEGESFTDDTVASPEPATFQSILYPAIRFDIAEGWEVREPRLYDPEHVWSANADILLVKGGIELTLPFFTSIPTGFEGIRCARDDNLEVLVQVESSPQDFLVRYLEDGVYVYSLAYLESDPTFNDKVSWEYAQLEDDNPNYCIAPGAPIRISGINSTIEVDPNGVGQDRDGDGLINAWLMKSRTNTSDINTETLAELDGMVTELFNNVVN